MEHNGGTLDGVLSNADLSSSPEWLCCYDNNNVSTITVSSVCDHHHYSFQHLYVNIGITFFGSSFLQFGVTGVRFFKWHLFSTFSILLQVESYFFSFHYYFYGQL